MIEIYDKNEFDLIGIISSPVIRTGHGAGYRTDLNVFDKQIPLFIPANVYERFPAKVVGSFVKIFGSIVRGKQGQCIYVRALSSAKLSGNFENSGTLEGRVLEDVRYVREFQTQGYVRAAYAYVRNIPEISKPLSIRVSADDKELPVIKEIRESEKIVVDGCIVPAETKYGTFLGVKGSQIKRK